MRIVCNSDECVVPSSALGFCSLSNLDFTQLCMTFDSCSPRHFVLDKGFSYTHLAGPEVSLHYIRSEFWASDGSNPSGKLSIKVSGYPTTRHVLHMSEPEEPWLPSESLH